MKFTLSISSKLFTIYAQLRNVLYASFHETMLAAFLYTTITHFVKNQQQSPEHNTEHFGTFQGCSIISEARGLGLG
jgi:hypothetical protein